MFDLEGAFKDVKDKRQELKDKAAEEARARIDVQNALFSDCTKFVQRNAPQVKVTTNRHQIVLSCGGHSLTVMIDQSNKFRYSKTGDVSLENILNIKTQLSREDISKVIATWCNGLLAK